MKNLKTKKDSPLVSVIIMTYNAAWSLGRCLSSLKKQTYPNVEIIVVDKYSTDETRKIAKNFRAKVYLAPKERCTQMNIGAKKARGKYLYFTGSDFEYDRPFIKKAVEKIERGQSDGIRISVLTKSDSFWGKVKGLERLCYVGDDTIETVRFLPKIIFEKIGGWDENLIAGEDYDLQARLDQASYHSGRVEDCFERHLGEATSLKQIFKKAFYYGTTIGKYMKKNPQQARHQMVPIRPAFIRHWKLFVKHPILTIGFIILKIVQYLGGVFGMVYIKWNRSPKSNEKE